MAIKQTRRGVSINRGVYDRFKEFCEAADRSMSSVAGQAILPHIEKWEREQAGKK